MTRRYSVARGSKLTELSPDTPGVVQGRRASNLEFAVYQALKALGWTDANIDFQVDVLGGHLPGGALLDFVVWSPAMPIIIEPNGDYWHIHTEAQKQRDKQRFAAIEEAWHRPFLYFVYTEADVLNPEVLALKLARDVGRGF